ncbi:MAG: phage tail tape measure protein [Syntrophomonas sp.]
MAETIGELLVRIGIDNSGFQSGMDKMNRSMRLAKAEFQLAAAQMGDFGSATDRLKNKADYLTKQIEIQKQKVSALKDAHEKAAASTYADSEAAAKLQIKMLQAEKVLTNMEKELKATTQGINQQSTALGRLKLAYTQASAEAKKSMDNAFESARNAGQKITMAGLGIAAGLGVAVKTTADFDSQMSKVRALADATAEDFKDLREQAIDLGGQTKFSASQAADGMQQLAAAGMNAKQIMDAMPGVLSAAAASGEEMALVSETMASTINTFELEAGQAGHVADVLAQAANSSAISVGDMANSLKYASPIAHSVGRSLEEVGAALIEMGNAGIKGEQAGTTLRGALTRLVNPPKEAADALASLNMSVLDSSGNMKPLGDIIGQLNEKMSGMTDAQKAATLAQIFGTEAVSGMMVLVNQGKESFDKYTRSLNECNGASEKAAKVMNDNLSGSVEQMEGAFESAGISLGTALAPAIRQVTELTTKAVEKFNALPDSTKETIAAAGALAAGLALIAGPALILVGILPSISAGASVLGITMGGVASTALGVVAPLVVVGWALNTFANHLGKAGEKADVFGKDVSDSTKKSVGAFLDLSEKGDAALKELAYSGETVSQEMSDKMVNIFDQMTTRIIEGLEAKKDEMAQALRDVYGQDGVIDENEKKSLDKANEYFKNREQKAKDAAARYKQITTTAVKENRSLTAEEHTELDKLRQQALDAGISALSKYESEAKVIKERVKATSVAISAQELSLITKDANERRQKLVDQANAEADESIKVANFRCDILGEISAEERDDLVKKATQQRDDVIKKANETRDAVVNAARSQAADHAEAVDKETGDILSGWDIWINRFKAIPGLISDVGTLISSEWTQSLNQMHLAIKEAEINMTKDWNDMKRSVSIMLSEIKKAIVNTWEETKNEAVQWGKNIIEGLKEGIASKIADIEQSAQDVVNAIRHPFQSTDGMNIQSPSRVMEYYGEMITEGLAKGMTDNKEKVSSAAELMVNAIKEAMDKVNQRLDLDLNITIAQDDLMVTSLGDKATIFDQLNIEADKLNRTLEIQTDKVALATKAYEDMSAAKGEDAEETRELYLNLLKEEKAQIDAQNAVEANIKAVKEQQDAMDTMANETLPNFIEEINQVKKSIDESMKLAYDEYLKNIADSVKKCNDDIAAANADLASKEASINQSMLSQMQQVTQAYEQQLDSRIDALMNYAGLFDQVTSKQVSGNQLLANLQGQVKTFDNWQKNIAELSAKGIDEGLLEELRQMGPKAAPEIAALNTLTTDQLTQYVQLWKQKQEMARTQATNELTKQRQEMNDKLLAIRQDTQIQLTQQAIETAQKINEIRNKASEELKKYQEEWEKKQLEIRQNAEEQVKAIKTKYEELEKQATVYGINIISNLIAGINSMLPALEEAMQNVKSTVTKGMDPTVRQSPSVVDRVQAGVKKIYDAYKGLQIDLGGLNLKNTMAAMAPVALGGVTNNSSSNKTINYIKLQVSSGGSAYNQARDIMRELENMGVRF